MQHIDSHQHFWKYDPVRDAWINDQMTQIKRDFFPIDLQDVLVKNDMQGCIAVQADESDIENTFLLELAKEHDFIVGVVGWLDFVNEDISEKLACYSEFPLMKGFRYILQGKEPKDLMLSPLFLENIEKLGKYNFTYDILIYADQLPFAIELVQKFPKQKFVIDHLAKPDIQNQSIDTWKNHIESISKFENVYCKVSGMVTEADWKNWKKEDFIPYLNVLTENFGTERLMFGSDWPVCLLAAEYAQVKQIVHDYFAAKFPENLASIFGKNAIKFYNISI